MINELFFRFVPAPIIVSALLILLGCVRVCELLLPTKWVWPELTETKCSQQYEGHSGIRRRTVCKCVRESESTRASWRKRAVRVDGGALFGSALLCSALAYIKWSRLRSGISSVTVFSCWTQLKCAPRSTRCNIDRLLTAQTEKAKRKSKSKAYLDL